MYYPGWRIRIYHNITRLEPDRMASIYDRNNYFKLMYNY